jgi:hypothetical protein
MCVDGLRNEELVLNVLSAVFAVVDRVCETPAPIFVEAIPITQVILNSPACTQNSKCPEFEVYLRLVSCTLALFVVLD